MKKLISIIFIIMLFSTGCSISETKFTDKDKIISDFKAAGYDVKVDTEVAGITGITRIKAVKGESIMEACYGVPEEDCETIDNYYADKYWTTRMAGCDPNKGIVFYTSDTEAWNLTEFDMGIVLGVANEALEK